MAKLTFIYGAMGSAKTAQALMKRYNYIENGMKVLLLKPSIDTRGEVNYITSRAANLKAEAFVFTKKDNLLKKFLNKIVESNFEKTGIS
jgi:thymidine kinase